MNKEITHNKEICRFEITVEGITGYVEYEPYNGGIDITHTIVPKPIGGRGIAADLVSEALEYARENGLKVTPTCSYVRVFFERYKDKYGFLEDKKESKFPALEGASGHSCGVNKPKS
jgi:predicted GNAT family acetyltransferase